MSTTSTIPQFGRKWNCTITAVPDLNGFSDTLTFGSNDWDTEGLKVEFEIRTGVRQALWFADIAIYNLNSSAANLTITQGMSVTLDAGYMNQPYGTIFDGTIYQPTWERIDVINYKLTLHCIVSIGVSTGNFAIGNNAAGIKQRDAVARMAAKALVPINILPQDDVTTTALNATTLSRGTVWFGDPVKYFEQATKYDNLNTWATTQGQQILSLEANPNQAPTVTVGTGLGLIGTPQQTQYGVDLRLLLNPNVLPFTKIQLDQSVTIRQLQQTPNVDGSNFATSLDQSGTYIVGGVSFVGDTRGNAWYVDVTGFQIRNNLLELLGSW